MTLGQRIAYARHKKGLSQRQLGKLVGVDKSYISYWETNIKDPNEYMLRKIITALEVSKDWLLGNDDNFSIKNPVEDSQFFKLTPKQQQLVVDNEKVIAIVYRKLIRMYSLTFPLSYDDIYGDAAIALCKAAKIYDESKYNTASFFSFAIRFVKFALNDFVEKRNTYYRHNANLNIVEETVEQIPAPDEWETLEYKILIESIYQKVESVLSAGEKDVFQLWLHGISSKSMCKYAASNDITRSLNITKKAANLRLMRAKTKCRAMINSNDFFA